MKATIKDIANITGYSVATVSRALNGKEVVGEKTRTRIQEVARELHYVPNAFARSLQKSRGYAIGMIVSDLSNGYFTEVFRGAEEVASAEGYSTIFANTDFDPGKEQEALRLLTTNRVDGLIIQVSNEAADECRALIDMGYPIVLYGQMLDGVNCPMVGCNNYSSSFAMTEYLIGQGHKKIAHVGGHPDTNTGFQRRQGFLDAMAHYGIEVREDWVLMTDYRLEGAYAQCRQMLEKGELPTAIFAANDYLAAGCCRAIREKGLRIPEDISLAGHDDTDIAFLMQPGLTTMRQQMREIGSIAAQKLLGMSRDGQGAERDISVVPTQLVVRDSVCRR